MLRKFSDGEFCTAEHRQVFQQQQSDLALARLIESQNRIERPAMPKPAPMPAMRTKAVVAEVEHAVPEARPIAEWFKPTGRKILFVPRATPFDPKVSSSNPGCILALQQQGFDAPEGMALGLELSPLARTSRQVVLNPLFRLGIRLPNGAKPMAPGLELAASGLQPLPVEKSLTGGAAILETPAESVSFAGAACIPVLFCGTVAPDRQDALAPEPMGLADTLMPLACPIVGPVPVRTVTEVELNTAHPPQRWAVLPAIAADRAAEPDGPPLPISETLLPVSLPELERGSVLAMAQPDLAAQLAVEGWRIEEDPGLPASPRYSLAAELRTETEMAGIASPRALSIASTVVEPEVAAEAALLAPAMPFGCSVLPEAAMATSHRTARMKMKAMVAAAGYGQLAVEALSCERAPGKPGGLVPQGGTDLAQDCTLHGIEVRGALDAARPFAVEAPGVEALVAASAPRLPISLFRTEPPEPVVTVPEFEDVPTALPAEEFGEPVFVRVVRPLIDDEAPAALSGMDAEEFAPEFAVRMMGSELAETPAAEAMLAEIPVSVAESELTEAPAVVAAEVESAPLAAQEAAAQEMPLVAEAEPQTVETLALMSSVEPETVAEEAAVLAHMEASTPEPEPEAVLAAMTALPPEPGAAEDEAEASPLTMPAERVSLEGETAVYPAVPALEQESVGVLAAMSEVTAELEKAPVEATGEPAGLAAAEAVQPAAVELTGPPECDQIRIFAGRGETGQPTKPRFSRADDHGMWPEALSTEPMRPKSRLMIDQADGSGPRRANGDRTTKSSAGLLRFDTRKLPGRRFWAHAPSDLKWVAVGLPLILALIVYSFKASPPKSETGRPVADGRTHSVIGGELNSIQKVILDRAAIKLYDDFRGGLGSWHGSDGWAKTWKYGEASFLEPGQLALYAPTVNMRDYTMQFLGQIERRSLNWVFRATDNKNYYAMRIVITKAGPLPQASVVRYAVINGKEVGLKTLPLPFPVHSDTLYLVKMEVRGDSFTTYIQSQVVDNFSDSRLEGGGIGFFSPKGDKSYLRWVEVTHQYDVLGRLCAFLAPYNVQAEGRKTE
ncbi:hypothetical protein [Paludibaculum fermentans]|uniref:hypothetical protein n=1 Tax=Paludibaculum fermentans TaxID=1473598 RepID=UPI003EB93D64